ncbi:MAG: TIGR03936 family radical SAM-associated protein [Lachnospiraceae bacterium]|nr:TIGR03936 family radical SAM-associated protein [Lachnospiraceae bacterium]
MEGSIKYRIKFKKTGCMKFLGHLDVLRYFQKAIKRADVPVAYSEGFNPHQLLSFAAPLSVGVEGYGEYFDMEMMERIDPYVLRDRLDAVMVDGMRVIDARTLPEKSQNCMASVTAAEYRISFKDHDFDFDPAYSLVGFYQYLDEIVITKKTKKSERQIDLKPLVYDCIYDKGDVLITLPCGSTENIKPELFMGAFYDYTGIDPAELQYTLFRLELFGGTYPDISPL